MFQTISRFLSGIIVTYIAIHITSTILGKKRSMLDVRIIITMIIMGLSSVILHDAAYDISTTLLNLILIIYLIKIIYKISISKAIITAFLVFIVLTIADLIMALILSLGFNYDIEQIRTIPLLIIMLNILHANLSYLLINIKPFNKLLKNILYKTDQHNTILVIIFCCIEIVVICLILMKVGLSFKVTKELFLNITLLVVIMIAFLMFVIEIIRYRKLMGDYQQMLNYVKHSEDWIEDYKIKSHEVRNQLIVIRGMASKNKGKELKEYIDALINNVPEGDNWINKLNNIPKEGLRGLLYYKIQQMEKEGINISLDISKSIKKHCLSELSVNDYQNLCTAIGVYLDNAIEAAKECSTKHVGIELYKDDEDMIIAISNTYKGPLNIDKFNIEGYSTKGKGRGYGLPLVKSILHGHNKIIQYREIVNNYYIQYLKVKEKDNQA